MDPKEFGGHMEQLRKHGFLLLQAHMPGSIAWVDGVLQQALTEALERCSELSTNDADVIKAWFLDILRMKMGVYALIDVDEEDIVSPLDFRDMIKTIPEKRDQDILTMRYLEANSIESIADRLSVSESVVRQRLRSLRSLTCLVWAQSNANADLTIVVDADVDPQLLAEFLAELSSCYGDLSQGDELVIRHGKVLCHEGALV